MHNLGYIEESASRMTPQSLRTRSFVLQFIILGYSLAAGAFHYNPPSFVTEPTGLIRLGIALAAGMLGVVSEIAIYRRVKGPPSHCSWI